MEKMTRASGPNWIHGTKENPILDLARQTNTRTHSWGERQATFDPYGRLIPEGDAAEASEILWDILGDAFRYSHDHSAEIPATESLMDFLKQKLDERELDSKQKNLLLQLSKEWGAFIGSTTEGQSLKFLWLEETLEGENLFCAGTYQKVLDLVSKSALEGARIVFGKKVTNIKSAATDERNPVVTLEFADGDMELFDEVVVTAPLGWLKRNQNAFEPALPKRISEAINELGYGNLDKVREFHARVVQSMLTFEFRYTYRSPKHFGNRLLRHRKSARQQTYQSLAVKATFRIQLQRRSHCITLSETVRSAKKSQTTRTPEFLVSHQRNTRHQPTLFWRHPQPTTPASPILFPQHTPNRRIPVNGHKNA